MHSRLLFVWLSSFFIVIITGAAVVVVAVNGKLYCPHYSYRLGEIERLGKNAVEVGTSAHQPYDVIHA